jgi:hypothetical protein
MGPESQGERLAGKRAHILSVHMLMTPLLVWWQTLQFSIGHKQVFFCKLSGLVAVAISLVVRAREQRERAQNE